MNMCTANREPASMLTILLCGQSPRPLGVEETSQNCFHGESSQTKAGGRGCSVSREGVSLSCGGLYTMTEMSRPPEPPKTGESHQTQMQKLEEVGVWERQENSPPLTPFNLKQSCRGAKEWCQAPPKCSGGRPLMETKFVLL